MTDALASQIGDAIELVVHELREQGVSALPQQEVGVYDRGVMRLNLDDVGRIAARVVAGDYDPDNVQARIAAYRSGAKP